MSSGSVSLLELVDLSLGTPEIVNYKGLRTVLIAIVENLKLSDVRADIKEADRAELLAAAAAASPSGSDRGSVESKSNLIRLHSADSSKEVHDLEKKVSRLESQIEALNSLPSNENLRARSTEGIKPMSEMWQLMQLQKKALANEEGVSKLMSMVEDLLGDLSALKEKVNGFGGEVSNLNDRLSKVISNEDRINERLQKLENSTANKDKMDELQKLMNDLNNRINNLPPLDLLVTWPAMEDALKGVYREPIAVYDHAMQTLTMTETSNVQTMPTKSSYSQTRTPSPGPPSNPPSRPGSAAHPSMEIQRILKDIGELRGKHAGLDNRVTTLEDLMKTKADLDDVKKLLGEKKDVPDDLTRMLEELKEGLDSLREGKDKMNELDRWISEQSKMVPASTEDIQQLKEDMAAMEAGLAADIVAMAKNLPVGSAVSVARDSEIVTNMQKLILQLQAEVDKLNHTCVQLVDEHNSKQKHIDALYTFVDRLQENKADKEHVIMEIDVKADKRALENKVSTTQFQGTVEELSRNLNDVADKLSGHRSAWQEAVSEMKLDIDNKLDRMELDPLKSYLDNRIKSVGAKMVRKVEVDTSHEDAAGFRKPLIQRYNCISCDRPLDMTPQPPLASLPESKGLPGMRSGRPYTTFELEQIRAAQKNGNNVDVPDYFATSRSCGGSHTMTYPHRRNTRMANLTGIAREEDVPVTFVNGKMEADIQGQDGHIYKGRIGADDIERLPTITPQKLSSARSPRPTSSRNHLSKSTPERSLSRPTSGRPQSRLQSRPTSGRPQSGRSLRSPTNQAEAGPRPMTPSNTIEVTAEVPVEEDSNRNTINEPAERPLEVQ
ncbi:uncharacterized protein LOC117292843 isoform X2 [Asterias rubens]|uniref:uncharacterized protein LOC117292843 isoform X2 n=1 Tax=Asterias rubens TaxID=7604 RepID=UPI00145577C7|nr:uncharacterized protein LOC117292843 isoform X2 [Asterias rubens]